MKGGELSRKYKRNISIWYPGDDGIPTQDQEYNSMDEDAINLAYYPNRHYNALLLPPRKTEDTVMEEEKKVKQDGDPSQDEGTLSNVSQGSQSI